MKACLLAGLTRLNISLPEERVDEIVRFGEAVLEKNKVMNLTAITEPKQAAELHLLDSLSLLKVLPLAGKSLLDVGTGAGFPGVPLKLAEPTLRLTLLDSLQKRMHWLEAEALPALGVEARFLPGRAEDFAREHRESFDVVASRAVARLDLLCELCLPFVHRGGYFLAMKGALAQKELHEAASAIRLLGGSYERTETFEIGGAVHSVIVIHKTGKTPEQYPRSWARMKQKPL
ncbi:MAG: 16S rRNA (guanine(527)-N(7))-methyltransferase RsmG [Oscillospiraceae bacterium]|nr:16S rRNA (guanine(527)-N(7))-methyltransferase RsmG [Oscillospiraceae bacterium]